MGDRRREPASAFSSIECCWAFLRCTLRFRRQMKVAVTASIEVSMTKVDLKEWVHSAALFRKGGRG